MILDVELYRRQEFARPFQVHGTNYLINLTIINHCIILPRTLTRVSAYQLSWSKCIKVNINHPINWYKYYQLDQTYWYFLILLDNTI